MSVLPSSWVTAPLGAFTIDCGQRVPEEAEKFKYIDIGSINRDTKRIETPQQLFGKDAPSRARKHVKAGDVLVSMTRPNLNAVALVPNELDDQIVSTGFDVLRASFGIEHRWVYYLARTDAFVEAMSELVQGALYPAVRPRDIRGFEAPLAPSNEQKRIADKLDAVLARVDACRDHLDHIPAILKRFRQSILAAATSGKLTEDWRTSKEITARDISSMLADERARLWSGRGKYKLAITVNEVDSKEFANLPSSWLRGTLDQIAWSVKDGPHFSPKYQDTGVPFISGGSIKPGKIDLSISKYISHDLHRELSLRCKPEYHDILYTKGGTTGLAAVNTLQDDFNVWVHVAVLKLVSKDLVNPFFVQYALNSPVCYAQSQRYTHGVGNQDLGLTRMIKIVLPVPPVEEQSEIVRRIETLFAYADSLEGRYITARAQVEKLTPATLAKAFRGELVLQDSNDEPASVLLERIRTKHNNQSANKPKRGRQSPQTKIA